VGAAEPQGKNREEQSKASENDAKMHLVEQIEVTVKAENEQSTRINNEKIQKDALSKVMVSAAEVLRGLTIKSKWVAKDSCTQYTLMVVSKESIAQVKQEKLMKGRLELFKHLLAEGLDQAKNRDIKSRRKHLVDARALLVDIDFSALPDERSKVVYFKEVDEALEQINLQSSKVQGRMALIAINKGGAIPSNVISFMLDQLRVGDNTTDRMMGECSRDDECITYAKESGFSKLTVLNVSPQIIKTQLGALKATLVVTKTIFDIESRKVIKGPDTASAQIIGWSEMELDWLMAAEKTMLNFK
jgi:hypothetical protein